MRIYILVILLLAKLPNCNAQQFEFPMIFVDAIGNVDSVILGYDASATDSLDITFGEVNIISTAYNSGLDVRAGNVWLMQNLNPNLFGQIPFETKKQILPNMCGSGLNFWSVSPIAGINLVSQNFPITAYWNNMYFNDTCRNGSVFTSVHPGGWWDTGGFREELYSADSITFMQSQFTYLSGFDTVYSYFVTFFDSTLLVSGIAEHPSNFLQVFPNPSSENISVKVHSSFGKVELAEFYDVTGQLVLTANPSANISISSLKTGCYFFKITNDRALTAIIKIIKQ